MLNEQVRRIMTTNPVVVSPDQKISEVSKMMTEKRIQQVPVVDKGQLVGLLTSFDLWKNSNSESDQMVSQVMTTNVLKITPIDKVGTAAELFMDKRFKTLPVVNLRNELKGVVTAFDVIRHLFGKEYEPRQTIYPEALVQASSS